MECVERITFHSYGGNKTDEAAQWMTNFVYSSMTARELLQDDQGMRKEFKSADAVSSIEESYGPQNTQVQR